MYRDAINTNTETSTTKPPLEVQVRVLPVVFFVYAMRFFKRGRRRRRRSMGCDARVCVGVCFVWLRVSVCVSVLRVFTPSVQPVRRQLKRVDHSTKRQQLTQSRRRAQAQTVTAAMVQAQHRARARERASTRSQTRLCHNNNNIHSTHTQPQLLPSRILPQRRTHCQSGRFAAAAMRGHWMLLSCRRSRENKYTNTCVLGTLAPCAENSAQIDASALGRVFFADLLPFVCVSYRLVFLMRQTSLAASAQVRNETLQVAAGATL